jgi:hypothetical protein
VVGISVSHWFSALLGQPLQAVVWALAEVEPRLDQNFLYHHHTSIATESALFLLAIHVFYSLVLCIFKTNIHPVVCRRMHPFPSGNTPAQLPRRTLQHFYNETHTHSPAQC